MLALHPSKHKELGERTAPRISEKGEKAEDSTIFRTMEMYEWMGG